MEFVDKYSPLWFLDTQKINTNLQMFSFYRSYLIWCWNNCCKLIRLIMQCIRSECVNTIPIKHSRAVVALIALWFHFMGLIWFTFTMRFFFMLLKIPIKWFDSNIIISNDVVKTNITHYNSLNWMEQVQYPSYLIWKFGGKCIREKN